MSKKDFIWTDELVMQYADFFNDTAKNKTTWASEAIETFKASHSSDSGGQKDWEVVSRKMTGNHPNDPIHSVKRLSDGEVFNVGDKVDYGVIEKFFIGWAGMEVHFTNGCGATLPSVTKLPPERSKDDFENIDRPPLGIIPTTVWKTTRLNELESAIIRYVNARREIPKAWITERDELLAWVKSLNLKYEIPKIKI